MAFKTELRRTQFFYPRIWSAGFACIFVLLVILLREMKNQWTWSDLFVRRIHSLLTCKAILHLDWKKCRYRVVVIRTHKNRLTKNSEWVLIDYDMWVLITTLCKCVLTFHNFQYKKYLFFKEGETRMKIIKNSSPSMIFLKQFLFLFCINFSVSFGSTCCENWPV